MDTEPRPPHFKRARISPAQRMARSKRKIAGYLRQIDKLRDQIDKQAALQQSLKIDYPAFFDKVKTDNKGAEPHEKTQ